MNESMLPVCINLYEGPGGAETSFQDRIYRADAIAPAITTCFRPWFLIMNGDYEVIKSMGKNT